MPAKVLQEAVGRVGCKTGLSHPRPLACSTTALNSPANADGDPAEKNFFLKVRSLQKWRVEGATRQHILKE